MDYSCPPSHRFGAWCASTSCPRVGLLMEASEPAERAPEHEEVQTASKQQKAARDLYREATQTAAKHSAEHGTLPERLCALNEQAKKITGSQSSAYLTGMPQIQPISQWSGLAREHDDSYRGRDLEHDRLVGWQPNAFADFKLPLLQPNTVPYNKNQMLPDWPGPFVLEQPSMGNSQADTFTDFAPGKNPPTSRDLSLASGKDASNTGENDGWSSEISSNNSEVNFTPEHTPEQAEIRAISTPTEASKVQIQPNSAHHNLSNVPGKPVYQFVPFRNVPRIINKGTGEDAQRWLKASNLPGNSGPASPESYATQDKHRRVPRPVRNDEKTNSGGSRLVRRDSMTFATGDLKNKIEKVARYVARSGPKFEEVVRSKNQGTDIVSFLEPTNTYHTYYKWRVAQCKAGNTYDFESEDTAAETDSWSEHINTDGRQHWYNKVSHEFVWDKPLALVAQFQPRKEIGEGIEKRELDFLGDCVKFLPFTVRSKAIAVVDKLQNIAYGALSDEAPANEEDDATKNLQKVEAALKLIESKHADTESALLKRIEELEHKQRSPIPEVTAAKLNTLYDKLGHIVDQGVQQFESGRKFDKDQELTVSKLQQRIEELEDKQASQKSDDTADRLERFKREVLETHSALLKNIQGVDGDMHSRTSELAATQDRICEEVKEVIDEQVKAFRDERTSIAGEHKEIVSALLKRIEDLETKQSSEAPDPMKSRLHEISDKLEHVDGRLTKFESVQEAIDTKNSDTLTELQQRIEGHDKNLDALQSEQQELFSGLRSARERLGSFESDLKPIKDEHVTAVAKLEGRMEAFEEQVSSDLPSMLSQLSDSISVVRLRQNEFETGRKPIDADHTKDMDALALRIETIENYQGTERIQAIDNKLHEALKAQNVFRNQIAALESSRDKQVEVTAEVDHKAIEALANAAKADEQVGKALKEAAEARQEAKNARFDAVKIRQEIAKAEEQACNTRPLLVWNDPGGISAAGTGISAAGRGNSNAMPPKPRYQGPETRLLLPTGQPPLPLSLSRDSQVPDVGFSLEARPLLMRGDV